MTETKPLPPLVIKAVRIRNVMSIEEISFEPGRHRTIFRGRNATGKTSRLEAMKNTLGGGASLANLARLENGQPLEPEVVIELAGEDDELKRLTKRADSTVEIESRLGHSAAFETVKRPAEWVRTVYDPGANPVRFLTGTPSDQVQMFLEGLPLQWDEPAVAKIVGEFAEIVEEKDIPHEFLHPVQRIEAIKDVIFDARTAVQTTMTAKRQAAEQTLRATAPEIPDLVAIEKRLEETKRAQDEAARVAGSAGNEVKDEHRRLADAAFEKRDAAATKAAAARDAAIAKANADFEAARKQAESEYAIAMEAANTAIAEKRAAAANADRRATELSLLFRDIRDEKETAIKIKTQHDLAKGFAAEADTLEGKAERMTATMHALERHKQEMVSAFAVPGITIESERLAEGEKVGKRSKKPNLYLCVDGIPMKQGPGGPNTAKRVEVAVMVAIMRCGRLRVLFLDGLEALDPDTKEALFVALEAKGVQFFGAEVTEGDFEEKKL